jgi:hypothetical protein
MRLSKVKGIMLHNEKTQICIFIEEGSDTKEKLWKVIFTSTLNHCCVMPVAQSWVPRELLPHRTVACLFLHLLLTLLKRHDFF